LLLLISTLNTIDVLLYSYLETYREDAPRFKEWFGNPNPEEWKKLETLFQKMDVHIPHGVYVCSECKGDNHIKANAYVKPKE
jgi:hypothetical protein